MWALNRAFTVVELLIVVVVLGILAAVMFTVFGSANERARTNKMKADVSNLAKAMTAAKQTTGKSLVELTTTAGIGTNNTGSGRGCWSKASGTDLATLDKATDKCWTDYFETLDIISTASNINVRRLIDPYGRPYYIDQSEGENVSGNFCIPDKASAYRQPFVTGSANDDANIRVFIGNVTTGC